MKKKLGRPSPQDDECMQSIRNCWLEIESIRRRINSPSPRPRPRIRKNLGPDS